MVHLGVIGAGVIARAHLGSLKQLADEVEVVGVSDIDELRREAAAIEFGIKPFATNAELLDAGVDGVVVCTFPKAHKECILEALAAGAHVFCEKPLAPSMADGREIEEAVRKSSKVFQIGYLFHFAEPVKLMRSMIESGELGDLAMCWSQRTGFFVPPAEKWISDDEAGGGIFDFCTHDVEFLTWLGGRPERVFAMATTSHPGTSCIDTVSVNMEFKTGFGTVLSTWSCGVPVMNIGVAGNKGAVAIRQYGVIEIYREGKTETREIEGGAGGVMVAEQKHFVDCITSGEAPCPGIDEALLALEVEDAAKRSAETGAAIALDSE